MEVLATVHGDALRPLQTRRVRKVLLAGETVFASLKPSLHDRFVEQAPRDAVAGLFTQFGKHVPRVHVSVDERLFAVPRARFALAIDGYLSWGLRERRRGATVLFGGAETPQSTVVTNLVFVDGRIVELGEKVLPERSATYFRDALGSMIAELRLKYPGARLVQAAPLENWELAEVEWIGDKPIRHLSYRPLTRGYNRRTAYLIPGAVAFCGLLAYLGAVGVGWMQYRAAVAEYDAAVADPAIRKLGGIDTSLVSVMTARGGYMESPRRQAFLADQAMHLVRGIGAAVPGVQILELKLPNAGAAQPATRQANPQANPPSRSPDVSVAIAVPKTTDTAIAQGESAMTRIAGATGLSLRLAHQGWRDDPGQGRRIFNLEGYFHD